MTKKIVLIGGGEIQQAQTAEIDKKIIDLAGGSAVNCLFFPTAANDSSEYAKIFEQYYQELGCVSVNSAKLSLESFNEVKQKIQSANLIYLGGGDTRYLIEQFRKFNIVNELKIFLERGGVLAGISAGASALTETSLVSEIDEQLEYKKGFAFLSDFIVLPHYNDEFFSKLEQIKADHPNKTILGIGELSAVFVDDGEMESFSMVKKI